MMLQDEHTGFDVTRDLELEAKSGSHEACAILDTRAGVSLSSWEQGGGGGCYIVDKPVYELVLYESKVEGRENLAQSILLLL